MIKKYKPIFLQMDVVLLFEFLFITSFFVFLHFFLSSQNLFYADAISRLDISRKVLDNINPGLAQLGNVWLPLPQILMLPFIWNEFLWHSGIAGAIMSMVSYILGGFFIYKSIKLLSNSVLSSFLGLLIYALNINILYLQTTAMSEALFLCTLSATIYFLLLWIKTDNEMYLAPAAFAISAMTFTRYEGLSILITSVPIVFVISLLKSKKYSRSEGQTAFFAILAITGFAAWTLYLTAIFHDPFYWLHYYATPAAKGAGGHIISSYSQQKPFLAAVWEYFTSTVWMDGLIPVLMAIVGIPLMVFRSLRNKDLYFLVLLMPLSLFLFMVLTLQRNTPIVQPSLLLANILNSHTSNGTGFNIRYGLLLLPLVAIVSSYLFSFKYKIVNIFLFSFFFIQLYSYVVPTYTVIFKIPATTYGKPYSKFVSWMKSNYNGGKILISASSHEDQMFLMGFSYKTYIHEGTGKYWKECMDDPTRYASWIVIDYAHPQDLVAPNFRDKHKTDLLARDYTVAFNDSVEQIKVYKVKDKPYFQIP